ncbi:hypothetical protein QBC40DRAFT_296223 [Triangularia verruculosa]|uniref:Uncharacterized protein n=1 Tax=Triangularia verruculosa TaxID=2587418 RepID=A0AAN7AXE0_9PEZI|nr:hypothetical protein QBC40DRAFT_296223 [Triangularia verruculosa]
MTEIPGALGSPDLQNLKTFPSCLRVPVELEDCCSHPRKAERSRYMEYRTSVSTSKPNTPRADQNLSSPMGLLPYQCSIIKSLTGDAGQRKTWFVSPGIYHKAARLITSDVQIEPDSPSDLRFSLPARRKQNFLQAFHRHCQSVNITGRDHVNLSNDPSHGVEGGSDSSGHPRIVCFHIPAKPRTFCQRRPVCGTLDAEAGRGWNRSGEFGRDQLPAGTYVCMYKFPSPFPVFSGKLAMSPQTQNLSVRGTFRSPACLNVRGHS